MLSERQNKKHSYWPNERLKELPKAKAEANSQFKSSNQSNDVSYKGSKINKKRGPKISQISTPSSVSSTNKSHLMQARQPKQSTTFLKAHKELAAAKNQDVSSSPRLNLSSDRDRDREQVSNRLDTDKPTISLDGRKLILGSSCGSNSQPQSMNITSSSQKANSTKLDSSPTQRVVNSKTSGYLLSNQQYNKHLQMSQSTFHLPSTITSSTAQLHTFTDSNNGSSMTIKRNVNLKYIKTVIIFLLALDFLITVFVHQYAVQDQIPIWFTSHKLRFSLLNLVLSGIWFVTLVGAILFDIYYILFISSVVDVVSLIMLLGFTIYHFYRRIDYNTVNLTSLLALLFSIIILHVYLVLTASLTIYLMLAVRNRQKVSRTNL